MENEQEPARTPPAASSPAPTPPSEPSPPAHAPAEPVRAERPARELGASFYAKLLALLFFVSYSIAFIVGNDTQISVDFVFATAKVSLIWTILLLLAVGLAGGLLLSHLYRHHRGKQPGKP